MPKYYDLHVHSLPECVDSPSRLKLVAKRYGYAEIAITNHSGYWNEVAGDSIINGIEIVASNPAELRKNIEKYRPRVDILLVHGGDPKINRAAVENACVDILAHPEIGKADGFNHVLAKSAADNDVAIEFNLDALIRLRGGARVRALSDFRRNLKLARKFDVSVVLTSNAKSHYDMRAPREMIALAGLFGMTEEEAIQALSMVPVRIIEQNRKKRQDYIRDGVEVVR
ncbi:MAG: ribonuclease P [Methanocellales archaeon]|nr:ribonuclease P [Methanocellales archaeon]